MTHAIVATADAPASGQLLGELLVASIAWMAWVMGAPGDGIAECYCTRRRR